MKEDLDDAGVSLNRLAGDIRVPMNRISAIVNGKRSIAVDTAFRLALFFGTSPQYWMNLQANYEIARDEFETGAEIRAEVRPFQPA